MLGREDFYIDVSKANYRYTVGIHPWMRGYEILKEKIDRKTRSPQRVPSTTYYESIHKQRNQPTTYYESIH